MRMWRERESVGFDLEREDPKMLVRVQPSSTILKENSMAKESKAAQKKVKKVMTEMKEGKLHSGSKKGPVVTNPRQGIAIALSEARKKGLKVGKKR